MNAVASIGHTVCYNLYSPIRSLLVTFTSQHRRLLLVMISLITLCSAFLACISIYLASLFYVNDQVSSLFTWVGLSLVGIGLLIICCVGLRGAYNINIELLLGFFWGVMVFLAPLIIGVITCFDLYQYVGIFYRHFWDQPSFKGVRRLFCESGTAGTLCAAPNHDVVYVTSWCLRNYNSTDCYSVRQTAIERAISVSSEFTLVPAVVGIFILGATVLTIYLCFRILTRAVITESMNDIINYLLILPIAGCAGMGYYMWDWQFYEGLPYSWSAKMFIAIAACQAAALPLGIFAGRVKSQALLTGCVTVCKLTLLVLI
jgi:hypothetical protein